VPLTIVAALATAALVAPSASADTYRVTRHDDPRPGRCKPDDCSLREAIRAANKRAGRDEVVLAGRRPRYELLRHNTGRADEDGNARGDLDVTDPITIRHGPGGRAIIDARGIDRVLDVLPGAATKLARIRLTGGNAVRDGSTSGGGVAARAPLRLVRSSVLGNRAASGGGVFAAAPLTLMRTRVRGNHARAGVGGGIDAGRAQVRIIRSRLTGNRAAGVGGGLAVGDATLRLAKSTVARNVAGAGAGGVHLSKVAARITQSTLSDNVAHLSGGGIHQSASSLIVVNSTVTRNRADLTGGGIQSSVAGGEVILNSVTVARNVANASGRSALGGGVSVKGGMFSVVNSIIALNRANATPSDCHGAFDSFGGNLVGTIAACKGFVGSALIGSNPELGSLRDNGGPTETLALKPGSPAIGRANEDRAPASDQRGRGRPAQADIGAFERLDRR
jgi:hypothetical protein